MNHHIIYKQKATITVAKEAEAYAVQNAISEVMRNELPQLLQEVFDSIAPGDDIIRIDSLQLDLGTLPAQNTGQAFKERVAEKIREVITAKTNNSASENGVSIIRKEQSLRESFLYFLQSGTKPWFIGVKNRSEWESGMQQRFAKDDWQKIIFWLRQNHRQQPVVIERLVQQFSDDFIEQIIACTIDFDNELWKKIYNDLLLLFTAQTNSSRQRILSLCVHSFLDETNLSDALYQVIKKGFGNNYVEGTGGKQNGEKNDGVITSTVITGVLKRYENDQADDASSKVDLTTKNEDTEIETIKSKEERSINSDENSSLQSSSTDNEEYNSKRLKDRQDIIDRKENHLAEINSSGNKSTSANNNFTSDKYTIPDPEKEPHYVSNAGIILLHPFLEMYFAEFDLLQKKKFRDDDACRRAVLLLHYLATGKTESEEWNLLLQKMMCGLSFEETLPSRIELTDKEKEESDRLLQSVINYCPPFKNTSVAGLRSTFLQREGRLEKKENGWLLTVEQKTVDILLDKIPWGFSTIKFPWLADMINVDWC